MYSGHMEVNLKTQLPCRLHTLEQGETEQGCTDRAAEPGAGMEWCRRTVCVFPVLGRDFSHDETLDVPTQVELLIKQATSHENLCQCYIGW